MADAATFSCNLALGQGFFYVSELSVKVGFEIGLPSRLL